MSYEPSPSSFRTFLIVWLTQSVSVIGSSLTYFAIIVWLIQTVYSDPGQQRELALAITGMSLAFSLPTVFINPLAGAFADRHDRKRIMILADAGNGLLSLVTAGLLLADVLRPWSLILILAAAATLGAFHGAAFDSSYVMLVPRKHLPRANGLMQTTWSLAGILAPALAATMIALPALARQGRIGGWFGPVLGRLASGAPLAIAVDAASFFLAALALVFLVVPSPKRTDLAGSRASSTGAVAGTAASPATPAGPSASPATPATPPARKSIWADVREGVLYLWRRRPLVWLLAIFAVVNLLVSPIAVVSPLLVKFRLTADWTARGLTYEATLALVSSIVALGGVAGGVLISAWGGVKKRRVWGVLVPLIPAAIAQAFFGLSTSLYLTCAMGFIMSAAIPIANAHSQTIWQTQTPPELQGRVFSVRRLVAQFTNPIGVALTGVLVGLVGASAVVAVAGAAGGLFIAGQMFNRKLLRVEDKTYLDNLAAEAEAGTS